MKYRSPMEERLHKGALSDCQYEPASFEYKVSRKYTPDFVKEHQGFETWFEVKGFFRVGDTQKYKAIRKAYPNHLLVFVFSNPLKKVRKGAKLTMAEWATKEGWSWTTEEELNAQGFL